MAPEIWRVLLCLMLLNPIAANAMRIHYNADRSLQLQACDQHRYAGREDEARSCYTSLMEAPDVLLRADAAVALGDVRSANRLFREASADRPDDPAVKTRWGYLYLETHQVSDAIALFREASLMDSRYLPAQLGLAEAMGDAYEGEAREALQSITLQHPENVHALILLARIELELQNVTLARGLLNRALSMVQAQSISPLEIFALHASANLLEAESMTPWVARALALNPHYSDIYSIPAHFYLITYRYREAVELYQKAVALQPESAPAHRDLGINLLRTNQVFAARWHLQRAYELDAYDAMTVNTLRLLDKLHGMRVVQVDVTDEQDPETRIGRILVRLDREDADALEPYVVELATRAFREFRVRYDHTLTQPMVVELFDDHDDFGVRTVGTPGIGLLGVTFGHLTAMDSPRARAPGEFHWGTTLWHEIAHVFTLEATNHLLPRWFSEGLSVYEEWNTGPLADRELSLDMLSAMQADKLLPITQLDSGFVRPTYPGQVQVSYMQAGLICDFIGHRWGHEALVVMLKRFAAGESTAEALDAAIGIDARRFDERFAEYLTSRYGTLIDSLDEYQLVLRQLERALAAEDWVSAEALARDVIRRYPERVGAGNAYEALAYSLEQQGLNDTALATLLDWQARGGHQPETLRKLIRSLREQGRFAEAAGVMEALNWVMPYGAEEHGWLGEHYLDEQLAVRAEREFDALLGLRPDDPASAYIGKARAALLQGESKSAERLVLQALETAPFFRPAQRLLLDLNTGVTRD